MGYITINIKKETHDLIEKCVNEYLRHHPEMQQISISKNKILFEVMKHYLKPW